jgi:hypothetical protein
VRRFAGAVLGQLGSDQVSRPIKALLGVLTVLPLIYIASVLVVINSVSGSSLSIVHILMMVLVTALWIYYMRDVFKNPMIPSDRRGLWAGLLAFGNIIVWPLYFWRFVWKAASEPDEDDAASTRNTR